MEFVVRKNTIYLVMKYLPCPSPKTLADEDATLIKDTIRYLSML